METAGDFVGIVVEFAARVENRKDGLERRDARLFVFGDGDAGAVVLDGYAAVHVERDFNVIAASRERLVDGVVDHFVD